MAIQIKAKKCIWCVRYFEFTKSFEAALHDTYKQKIRLRRLVL